MYGIASGASYTEAAHLAGFADSAHLSRTYRRMFGMKLVDFQKRSQIVEAINCF
jgi:AraC-like DNA-binding protein